jgi:polyisoprenoid-binding protein YceI
LASPQCFKPPRSTETTIAINPATKGIQIMKRFAAFAGILALTAPLALAQTSTWKSDPAHSEVDFSVSHLTISRVHGRFGHVTATLTLDEGDIAKSSVTATIEVSGVDTGEEARNNHLKSDSFFDVAKFPTATFTSTSVTKTADGLSIAGNLTLHGVTKPVLLTATGPTGPVPGMDHKQHAGFSASTTVSRSAFGIGNSFPSSAIGDEVKLNIELDVEKQ